MTRTSRATVGVRVDRAVAIVELRRPETLNAFNITLGRELLAVLEEIERDRSIGAVVLTGAGTSRPAPRCWSRDEAENPVLPEPRGPVGGYRRALETVRAAIDDHLTAIGRKVYAIVNYDNVYIAPDLMDAYTQVVQSISERCCAGVTRYTTSSFMRLNLGHALAGREVAPHIYETRQEAAGSLASGSAPPLTAR